MAGRRAAAAQCGCKTRQGRRKRRQLPQPQLRWQAAAVGRCCPPQRAPQRACTWGARRGSSERKWGQWTNVWPASGAKANLHHSPDRCSHRLVNSQPTTQQLTPDPRALAAAGTGTSGTAPGLHCVSQPATSRRRHSRGRPGVPAAPAEPRTRCIDGSQQPCEPSSTRQSTCLQLLCNPATLGTALHAGQKPPARALHLRRIMRVAFPRLGPCAHLSGWLRRKPASSAPLRSAFQISAWS